MRPVFRAVVCVCACLVGASLVGVLLAGQAGAQTEQQLRQAFEGRYVVVRLEMPATHKGVDVHPERDPSVDFPGYSARLREFGVALREGDRVLVTAVRVKKKNIELHLGGGGYGVWGDDSGSVYVPSVSKSSREKDLEKDIKRENDPDRRRRMQRELDQLRREREREQRDRDEEKRDLEERKQSEIADKRLGAGSRVNVWFPDERLVQAAPTPQELRRMLSPVIDFGDEDVRPPTAEVRKSSLAAPPLERERAEERRGRLDQLSRGMTIRQVQLLLGEPTRSKFDKQGDLKTLTELYEDGDRVTEVVYVAGIVIRFSTSSK